MQAIKRLRSGVFCVALIAFLSTSASAWEPTHPGWVQDVETGHYFGAAATASR